MEASGQEFINMWHQFALNASIVMAGVALLFYIFHHLRLATIKSYSKKYEYVSAKEARNYWFALLSLVVAGALFLNSYVQLLFDDPNSFEFYIGLFISLILGAALGYAAYAYMNYYYPGLLESKLNRLRFKPRISPETGKKMKLLSEEEEDVHLTEEMIQHEESFAYEYDVWLDEETGHKFIERYDMHYHAEVCPNCNFRTLKDKHEEVIKSPTYDTPGLLVKHMECSYCDHKENRESTIAALNTEENIQVLS